MVQLYGEHDGKKVMQTSGYKDRWVERFHGRETSKQENLPYEFECTKLVHFTGYEAADRIADTERVDVFAFTTKEWDPASKKSDGYSQKNPDETIRYLSWWMAYRPDDWRTTVEAAIPELKEKYQDVLGNSVAFDGDSEYGPIGFVIPWIDIRKAYAEKRGCQLEDVDYRILGTFKYRAEIMYAVLICIKTDAIKLRKEGVEVFFSSVTENGTEAFVYVDDDKFVWKAYSTIGFSCENGERPKCDARWTWDNLAIAFYMPNEEDVFDIARDLFTINDSRLSGKKFSKLEEHVKLATENAVKKLREKITAASIEKAAQELNNMRFTEQSPEQKEVQEPVPVLSAGPLSGDSVTTLVAGPSVQGKTHEARP